MKHFKDQSLKDSLFLFSLVDALDVEGRSIVDWSRVKGREEAETEVAQTSAQPSAQPCASQRTGDVSISSPPPGSSTLSSGIDQQAALEPPPSPPSSQLRLTRDEMLENAEYLIDCAQRLGVRVIIDQGHIVDGNSKMLLMLVCSLWIAELEGKVEREGGKGVV